VIAGDRDLREGGPVTAVVANVGAAHVAVVAVLARLDHVISAARTRAAVRAAVVVPIIPVVARLGPLDHPVAAHR
jgi:hypothetical protein